MVGALPYKTIREFLSRSNIIPSAHPQPRALVAAACPARSSAAQRGLFEHGACRRGRCSLISAANTKRAFSKGVLPEIGRFSSTREEFARRRRVRLITRMPPTWPFSYASFATASCEGGKTPSEGLLLMKTARFLAGWGVFSAIRQKRTERQGLVPRGQAKCAEAKSPSPWAWRRAPRAVPQRSEDCLSTGYAATTRGVLANRSHPTTRGAPAGRSYPTLGGAVAG